MKRNKFLAWLMPLPKPDVLVPLLRALDYKDQEGFIESSSELAKMGFSSHNLDVIAHAMVNRRILAFSHGNIVDLGEYRDPATGATRGTPSYGTD